jgi:capsular polysaccharide biosynthesis protein
MMTIAPLAYAVRRSLSRRRELTEMAARSWVIEPESTQVVPKAVYIDSTLARVTAPAPFSTLQIQYDMIAGGKVTHRPIRAFGVRNAALIGSSYYVRGFRMPLAPDAGFRAADLVNAVHIPQAALGCTYFGNMFFGHFWTDDVPLMQLGAELGETVRPARRLSDHQRDLLGLLGLTPHSLRSATFQELIVFEDPAQTKSKELRYRRIREAFAARFHTPDPPRGVFLFRGQSGKARRLVNEEEVASALAPHGIIPVHPERLTLAELARTIWGARLVVGVEGSQMLHGFYGAAESASFLALIPPMRFGNIIKNYTDCLGMKYGFVVGEPQGDDFKVDLDEVLKVIDALERRDS